jgi:5-methylcytosine-specific restriction endonuclease McrA
MRKDYLTRFKVGHKQSNTGRTWFKKGQVAWNNRRIDKLCKVCNKEFTVSPCEVNRKYCSHKCYSLDQKGKNHSPRTQWKSGALAPLWKGGIQFEPYSNNFNTQLKERVRVRDNFVCQVCGVPELELNKRLLIHHIDYNKKNGNMDNLISLCRSCHSKTNGDRKYWREEFSGKNSKVI